MLPIPVFRVEKNANYTTMSNYHLRDNTISFKAKGILSMFLSLPKDWSYSVSGLAAISKEGKDGILSGLKELEAAGYLERHRYRNERGRLGDSEYVIYGYSCAGKTCGGKALTKKYRTRKDRYKKYR